MPLLCSLLFLCKKKTKIISSKPTITYSQLFSIGFWSRVLNGTEILGLYNSGCGAEIEAPPIPSQEAVNAITFTTGGNATTVKRGVDALKYNRGGEATIT